jgi:hypothetical protein
MSNNQILIPDKYVNPNFNEDISISASINTDLPENTHSQIKNNLINELEHIQHIPINKPNYDGNYIIMNRKIKFLLNFIISFIFLKLIIGKYPTISINQLILLFCTVSSILLYILDSIYPSCNF